MNIFQQTGMEMEHSATKHLVAKIAWFEYCAILKTECFNSMHYSFKKLTTYCETKHYKGEQKLSRTEFAFYGSYQKHAANKRLESNIKIVN